MQKKLTCLFAVTSFICFGSAFADAPDSVNEKQSHSEAPNLGHRSGVYAKFTGAALAPNETGIGSFTDSWQSMWKRLFRKCSSTLLKHR